MILPMLAVDKDIELSMRIQAEWLKRGITTVRVDAMQEAINKLIGESFLLAAINADSVNYLPLLRIMSDISPVPIFIMTSNFTESDQIIAFQHGADGYSYFDGDINPKIDLALALLQRYNTRAGKTNATIKPLTLNDILISSSFRKVFCNDAEISLTKTEFDILWFLMTNHDHVLSFSQIYNAVWGTEYDDATIGNLHQHVFRIRSKFMEATGHGGYIESESGVGFRFSTITCA